MFCLGLRFFRRTDVLLRPEQPCGVKSALQSRLVRLRQANVSRAHSAPAAPNGKENLRQLFYKFRLLFWRKHQVAIAILLRGERGENPAAYTKIGDAHVAALFRALKAQGNFAKIGWRHIQLNCSRQAGIGSLPVAAVRAAMHHRATPHHENREHQTLAPASVPHSSAIRRSSTVPFCRRAPEPAN